MGQWTMSHVIVLQVIKELGGKAKLQDICEKLKQYGYDSTPSWVEHLLFELSVDNAVRKSEQGEWIVNQQF